MTENILLKLSEGQRLSRFIRVAGNLYKVGQKQLELLKDYERQNKNNLHTGFLYFIKTLDGFWDNFDFLMSLGKSRNRIMAHFPVRSMLETTFRLEHYINEKRNGQNYIADVELLRIYKRIYDDMVSKQEDTQAVEATYNSYLAIAGLNSDPTFAIQVVKEDKIDPFPSLYQLIQKSKLSQAEGLYFHYRILCEHSHGKLVAHIMRNSDPKRSYRQMLMYGCIFAREMLKIVDHHIQGATKKEVEEVILKTNNIANSI